MGFRDKNDCYDSDEIYIFSSLPHSARFVPIGNQSQPRGLLLKMCQATKGNREIVCLVGCKRASLWEGGGLNGRLSPRRKESHWISSLTVRFATTKSPVKLPCELCCVRDRIIQVILKESKFSSINLQISAVRPNPFNPFALTKTVSGKSS